MVYVLKSDVHGNLYVGITDNLERRMKEHEARKNRYTKGLRSLKLYYKEYTLNMRRQEKEKFI